MSIAQAHALLTSPGSPFEMETLDIRGVQTRAWKNAPPTLRSVLEAGRGHGDKIFLVYEDERVSFEAFYRADLGPCARAARQAAFEKGDRVAIAMRNLPEWPVAFYAAQTLGAIVTPLNAWWTGPELEYGLTDSGTKVAIVDAAGRSSNACAEHLHNCPDLKRIYVSREAEEVADPKVIKLESVLGATADWASLPDRALPDVEIGPEDYATIFYTSGTTGKPKGALASNRNVNTNILTGAIGGPRAFLRRGERPPAPDPNAAQMTSLLSVPFFHATGCFAILNPGCSSAARRL